jgi:beta-lactamase regulating signal transducer with metallopeptidase domain
MSAALLDHLWQSSLVALGAWLAASWLRGHSARARHVVWFAASLKFLLPFSLLAMAGEFLRMSTGIEASSVFSFGPADLATRIAAPATHALAEAPSPAWLVVAAIVWSAGSLALLLRWGRRLHRIRRLVRLARPVPIPAPIPVMASELLREPGVVGIWKPVLLLPAGIEKNLTAPQLRAIVAHEMCHVRRHDNLVSAIHMLVEALFWFFPPVWWIGARMLDERERACDEAVLRSGNDPRAYAEGILKVCRSGWATDLPCVAGVSGADLKLRLEAIMKNETVQPLGRGKKLLLGTAVAMGLLVPLGVGLAGDGAAAKPAAAAQAGKIELLSGKRVKLNYQNVEVRSLIRAMGDAAQVNILVSDQVRGTVTLSLLEMPWDQAFDIILNSQGLTKRESNGILYVEPAAG